MAAPFAAAGGRGVISCVFAFIVAAAMLIISLFYDRRQINAGTIVYQIIYSFFVDVFAKINVYPEQAWLRLAVMCVGIIIFAAGTGAYAAADLGKGSYEALTFSLAEKNNWPVKTVRTALDALLVVSGVLLGGKFGICTVFTVLCSGLVIQRSAEFCSLMLAKAAHRAD